ncbi:sensor histidine kinase [Myceligenerans crystallogenes]|uniref:Histidine kinase/HSP90-like ATPase domain-containing protein n=1 Tax=Myceligenerans crystallogenes TaxID=316335 RepID=A0ABN2N321_9MICO
MDSSPEAPAARGMDSATQRAVGPMVRLLCQVRLVVLAFALVTAVLDGAALLGVLLVMLAAPFSFVPALNWDLRGNAYARNGLLLAADVVVAVIALIPLAGSPLMTVYSAATAALWGLFAGPRLGLVMAVPLALFQVSAYEPTWRGVLAGATGAVLTALMTWTGSVLGRRLRQQAETAAELARVRERQAVLAERLRLARDLHDTVAGDLAGLAMTTGGLAGRLAREGSPPPTVDLARRLHEAVEATHRQTRTALGELREERHAVTGAVTELAGRWAERTGIPVDVSIVAEADDVVGPGRARHVRAVVGELLENVRRHAAAGRASVTVATHGSSVEVLVSDDGRGLPGTAHPSGHYGLRGIQERAALCGGEATWTPAPGGGTAVRVSLPAEPAGSPIGGTP